MLLIVWFTIAPIWISHFWSAVPSPSAFLELWIISKKVDWYAHQIVPPIFNSESANFVMITFSTDKLRKKLFWNNIGFLFQLLHKLRKLVKQNGANIWWIRFWEEKNWYQKPIGVFLRFVPIVYIWLKKLIQIVTTFHNSRFMFQKIQFT